MSVGYCCTRFDVDNLAVRLLRDVPSKSVRWQSYASRQSDADQLRWERFPYNWISTLEQSAYGPQTYS